MDYLVADSPQEDNVLRGTDHPKAQHAQRCHDYQRNGGRNQLLLHCKKQVEMIDLTSLWMSVFL